MTHLRLSSEEKLQVQTLEMKLNFESLNSFTFMYFIFSLPFKTYLIILNYKGSARKETLYSLSIVIFQKYFNFL